MAIKYAHLPALAAVILVFIPNAASPQGVPTVTAPDEIVNPEGPIVPSLETPEENFIEAPFTFVVPVRLATMHHDVKRIYLWCRVYAGTFSETEARRFMGQGGVYLTLSLDSTGFYADDVTVPVYLDSGEDPTDAQSYDCFVRISNSDTGVNDNSLAWTHLGDPTFPWSRASDEGRLVNHIIGTIYDASP